MALKNIQEWEQEGCIWHDTILSGYEHPLKHAHYAMKYRDKINLPRISEWDFRSLIGSIEAGLKWNLPRGGSRFAGLQEVQYHL